MRGAPRITAGATVPFPNGVMRLPVDDGVSAADGSAGLTRRSLGRGSLPRRLYGELPLQIITGQV
ncbi:hypothetical protein LMG29542_08117 [Paraburkholderia humisilvae]|uniref:Uncharacterized protein n=1 Tax=Paraburkholderia humisilvae TaxID=627669 RepID=A0A6J5F7G8_9BURK|nr:hypothetical protein LMG29542_08117 [Paraburkholderia humisilvae]